MVIDVKVLLPSSAANALLCDALDKLEQSDPAIMASLLRAVLPADLVALFDLDELRLVPGTFVDEEQRDRQSDVLMSTRLCPGGEQAYVYCLMENQGDPDPMLALWMLDSIVRIWRQYLEQHGGAELPLILPVVLHASGEAWTCATNIRDLIAVPSDAGDEVEQLLPHFEFVVGDLTKLAAE